MDNKQKKLQNIISRALKILGIRNLLCGIHDPAFPSRPDEDIGRGSPYSQGAADFLRFITDLGFTGIQLGPQGITTPTNPSPYDGSLFSRNPLSLSLARLYNRYNITPALPDTANMPGARSFSATRVDRGLAGRIIEQSLAGLFREFRQEPGSRQNCVSPLHQDSYRQFRSRHASWLHRDALYELLRHHYQGKNWQYWNNAETAAVDRALPAPPAGLARRVSLREKDLCRRYGREMENYYLVQYLIHEQHLEFKQQVNRLGLKLFGDLQIGFSGRDAWRAQSFLLAEYVMGAPPSRTNPDGQPWNYPILDPDKYFRKEKDNIRQPGPALLFLQQRLAKMCREYDGLRIDHPHGLVCPWVYRKGQPDPIGAVQQGARLFASPALDDHPSLGRFAIPRPDQLDPGKPRYDNNWVISLEPVQVRRYGVLFEVIMQTAQDNGCGIYDIACEILSTQPYPIKRVMELYGLGRFRITQKADLDNPADVYRGENAAPEDWIMLGNHDTPSIWQMTEKWQAAGLAEQQAAYLAGRLNIPRAERPQWIRRTAAEPGELARAKCADLLVGPARNIMIYFTDLLGIPEQYNSPGSTGEENWSMRIDPDFRDRYSAMARQNLALNIPGVLALALRARRDLLTSEQRQLIAALEAAAASPLDY